MQKTYEVKIYYSTFYTQEVEAESEEAAIEKAIKITWQGNVDAPTEAIELLSNLEQWPEAHTAELL